MIVGFRVYPRVGGGTDLHVHTLVSPEGLSPRGRGNLQTCQQCRVPIRSIPAWAGEPQRPGAKLAFSAVYPRVGGGTRPSEVPPFTISGLSPRGRRNLCRLLP